MKLFQGSVFIFQKSSIAHNVTFITNYLDNVFSNNAYKWQFASIPHAVRIISLIREPRGPRKELRQKDVNTSGLVCL